MSSVPLIEELVVLLLCGQEAAFSYGGVLNVSAQSTSDQEFKNIVKETQRKKETREQLGHSRRVWHHMTQALEAGNKELAEGKHHNLAKVWDIVLLARNLLAAKEVAQDLAAEEGFEAEVRRLLHICIEHASKPLGAEQDKAAHDKELQTKGGYKKIMITCLQFINNLITGNETRKLHIWLHLFGTPSSLHATTTPLGKTKAKPTKGGKNAAKSPPAPGSGVGPINVSSTPGVSAAQHNETAAKCNSLSAGFNTKHYKPGFLTNIPRLLQPDEIEPLLIIIQSGVSQIPGTDESMQAVRCKLMLAQGSGRDLFREILVFLGAWEVDEDDFCHIVLTQITEAILLNGLAPYAYESFKSDGLEIVTPAQSVLLKLLVSVYKEPRRLRHPHRTAQQDEEETPILQMDKTIPPFFINAFRKSVIDEIIKIVRLQGEISKGTKSKDEFTWSLWDLDRIYEGVYQFLELFVLFSEDHEVKAEMAKDWGFIGNIIQLLGEMDKAIPRYLASKDTKRDPPKPGTVQTGTNTTVNTTGIKENHMVERPFDLSGDLPEEPAEDQTQDGYDDDNDRDLVEPEEFTWPHVKRFCVNLISNLTCVDDVVPNKEVQDFVREHDGLVPILNQCKYDDDNPYIREYAIICLKGLLGGNLESQEVVRSLEAKKVEVPEEVLDRNEYEHLIDNKGRMTMSKRDRLERNGDGNGDRVTEVKE